MAISRMQQPRQMYGLGSFVKKATKKLTKPVVKIAKKLVPKEIAGIMRVAAPFLPPGYREAAYLLGTARQTGRISPVDLALAAAPTFFEKTKTGQNLTTAFKGSRAGEFLLGSKELGTSGIIGQGGDMFQFGEGSILDTKAGQFLLGATDKAGNPTKTFSIPKVVAVGAGTLTGITTDSTPREEGIALAQSPQDPDARARGEGAFSLLRSELFRVPERFRLPVSAANGGLMRTNYAIGSGDPKPVNPFAPKPTGPVLPNEDKPFRPKPLKPIKMSEDDDKGIMMMAGSDRYQRILEELINELEDQLGRELTDAEYDMAGRMAYERLSDPDYAIGGRVGYALGTGRTELTKPMLSDKEEKENMMMAGSDRYQRILEELINQMEEELGRPLTDAEYDMVGRMAYERLSDSDYAVGGRVDYALGTRPTAEESGLGGLPIEADMRYTGGFMPYGAKEKADDVPARLSKNEFVFTADAVRAAGGGSVNEGAKKMYRTMKQLEAKPEAKGMTA